jgi:hypothetical protein
MRTKLKSKVTLLFVVSALLLAIPAVAALAQDTGTSTAAPTIQSDKADYAPGELVTLTGSGWQAGESVHINVNDDQGQTWSRDADVTADANGNITDSFNLPDWVVATYTVTATGELSGVATTSFTDGNVLAKTSGLSLQLPILWIKFNNSTTCSSVPDPPRVTGLTNTAQVLTGVDNGQSIQLHVGNFIQEGKEFVNWSSGSQVRTDPVICVAGSAANQEWTANYSDATRATTTTLARTTGSATSTYGDSLTFTATVTANDGNPNGVGTVDFKNGSAVICDDVPLSGNTATCSPTLNAGSYNLTAVYSGTSSGSPQFQASTSTALSQTFTIGKKELLVNAKDQSTVYGDENLPPTYELSGFVNNEDKDSAAITGAPECSISDSAGPNVGEYNDAIVCAPGTLSADNYSFAAGSKGKLTITKRPITVTAESDTKAYDGTISSSKTPTVTGGIVSGDQANFSQACDTKNVGQNKTLTPSGSVNDNNGGNNYQLSFVNNTNGEITAKELTASFTADNKVYDGNDSANIATRTLQGMLGNEDVSLDGGTAKFNDKNVANGKTVSATGFTLAGADKDNYKLEAGPWTTQANITPKELTGSFTAENKVYDGTTDATIATRSLSGEVSGDDVSLSGGTATFGTASAGQGKTVSATDFTLAGNAKANYTLKAGPWTATADINPAPITVTAANQSKKLGDPNPTFTASYSGFVNGEDKSVLGGILNFTTNVPSPEQVGTWDITPSGLTSSNYSINFVKGTLTITYKFDGFRSPVDNPGTGSTPIFNSAKAGQSIPVKFGLGGNQGLNIIAAGYPKVTSVNCVSSATVVPIEEYATSTAEGGLNYDATANQYNYVWKTQSTYVNKCFKFDLQLTDGTSHVAYFKFLK